MHRTIERNDMTLNEEHVAGAPSDVASEPSPADIAPDSGRPLTNAASRKSL